ncbi:MAG TPA: hypothetical protein ENH10_07085 [Bacteroidetes bacterium]|nr:hypothetical protein BMS3Bbin04_01475 [bacterium BMS3Bbin04]HDO65780.1 hypothetical protein [Bacteroidota bacterium]HEX04905.1 hypothetical protein [Bacteroidota bacterium]
MNEQEDRSILSKLPETFDEFFDDISFDCNYIDRIAKALGVYRECDSCDGSATSAEEFEEALAEHYHVESDLCRSGDLMESYGDAFSGIPPSLSCPYHTSRR